MENKEKTKQEDTVPITVKLLPYLYITVTLIVILSIFNVINQSKVNDLMVQQMSIITDAQQINVDINNRQTQAIMSLIEDNSKLNSEITRLKYPNWTEEIIYLPNSTHVVKVTYDKDTWENITISAVGR